MEVTEKAKDGVFYCFSLDTIIILSLTTTEQGHITEVEAEISEDLPPLETSFVREQFENNSIYLGLL